MLKRKGRGVAGGGYYSRGLVIRRGEFLHPGLQRFRPTYVGLN